MIISMAIQTTSDGWIGDDLKGSHYYRGNAAEERERRTPVGKGEEKRKRWGVAGAG